MTINTPPHFNYTKFMEAFPPGSLTGLDVETIGLDHWAETFKIRLLQFATTEDAWVLDPAIPEQREAAIELLQQGSFCSHTNFDVLAVYVDLGVDITDRNLDVHMLASMVDTVESHKRDLKTLSLAHIGPELVEAEKAQDELFMELWVANGGKRNASKKAIKGYGFTNVPKDSPIFLKYAGLDAIYCRRLVDILLPLVGCPQKLLENEIWLAAQANKIQLRGFLLDQEAFKELSDGVTTAAKKAYEEFESLTGVKPGSPRVVDWFEQHGVNFSNWKDRTPKKKEPSITKDNVHLLASYPLDDEGKAAHAPLSAHKQHSGMATKAQEIQNALAPDGRVHPHFNTLGASATGRFNSSAPNFQNFPKDDLRLRNCFIPEPNHVLISSDYDSVEMRTMGAIAPEPVIIEAAKNGVDFHVMTAERINRSKAVGKTTNFAAAYGSGPVALADSLGIEEDEGEQILNDFWGGYPGLADFRDEMCDLSGCITTATGRRLALAEVTVKGYVRMKPYANFNYAVQSNARDLLMIAWHKFATEYNRAEMVYLPIHDELCLMVPEDLVDTVIKEIEECMNFDFLGCPITATAKILKDEHGVSRWGK